MSKALGFFLSFIFTVIFLFFSKPSFADHIPVCNSSINYTSRAFSDNFTSGHDCPAGTVCYDVLTTSTTTSYGCYKAGSESQTSPTNQTSSVSQPPEQKDIPITITPDPAQQGQQMIIKINYFEGFGTLKVSVGPPNIESSTMIFTVDGNGCKKESGDARFKSLNCTIFDKNQQTWAADIGFNVTFNPGNYEVTLTGQSGNTSGRAPRQSFCVNSCEKSSLNVQLDPTGPFDNSINNQIIVSWTPAEIGSSYQITVTGHIFNPTGQTCQHSVCSKTITIPKNQPPGIKTITVVRDGNTSIFGNQNFELRGIGKIIPAEIGTKPQCRKKGDKGVDQNLPVCTSSKGEPCTDTADEAGKGIANIKEGRLKQSGLLTALGCINTDPVAFVNELLRFSAGISGGIALLLMIFGSIRMMTSAGDAEQLKAGREQFASAVVGLLFIIFSVLLLQIIGVNILKIPGLRP